MDWLGPAKLCAQPPPSQRYTCLPSSCSCTGLPSPSLHPPRPQPPPWLTWTETASWKSFWAHRWWAPRPAAAASAPALLLPLPLPLPRRHPPVICPHPPPLRPRAPLPGLPLRVRLLRRHPQGLPPADGGHPGKAGRGRRGVHAGRRRRPAAAHAPGGGPHACQPPSHHVRSSQTCPPPPTLPCSAPLCRRRWRWRT